MIWRNWNKADKTLLAAAVIFCFALCLKVQYPGNVWAGGFLFCAEAALVGGIADWFAVTALFEKPLGFPWHTAILPRRRESFMAATANMLQKEFFGKTVLLKKIKGLDLAAMLLGWLAEGEHRQLVAKWLSDNFLRWLEENKEELTKQFKGCLEIKLDELDLRPLLLRGCQELEEKAKQPACREMIKHQLQDYLAVKEQGGFAMLLSGLAQTMNILNFDEASEIAQRRFVKLLHLAQQAGTKEYEQFVASAENLLKFCEKNFIIKQDLHTLLLNNLTALNLREYIYNLDSEQKEEIRRDLEGLLGEMVQAVAELVAADATLRQEVNGLLYQFAARSVLQAQELLGDITRSVLGTMTDEQVNRLVYDKAEQDLLWIRMNGSIVGSAVGLVIYVVMQLTSI